MPFSVFTSVEKTILDEIRVLTDKEAHCFMSEDGQTLIRRVEQGPKGGNIPDDIDERLQAGEKMRLLHNHPTGGSLSVDDLLVLDRLPDVLETVVVTRNGSIFRAAKHAWDQWNMTEKKQTMKDVLEKLNLLIDPHVVPDHDLRVLIDRMPRHFLCYRLYEVGALDYLADLSAEDNAILFALYDTSLKAEWRQLLEDRIK